MALPGAPRSGAPAPARRPGESGGGASDAQRAHTGSLPAVQGVQSRSAAAVQTAWAHRGTRLGRTQPRAMLRAVGAGSPAARSAFGLRAGAPQPLPATRPRLPSSRFASWFPSRATLASLFPCPDTPIRCRGSGARARASRRPPGRAQGGRDAGGRAGGRVPSSPAPMGREAGAGALCRSDSRAAIGARGKEPGPPPRPGSRLQHPPSCQRLGTNRHKGGASGSSALPTPETAATHRQRPGNLRIWTTNQKLGGP